MHHFCKLPFFVQIKRCRSHKCFSSKSVKHILFSFTKKCLKFYKKSVLLFTNIVKFLLHFQFLFNLIQSTQFNKNHKRVAYATHQVHMNRMTFTNKLITLISQYVLWFSHFSIPLQYINCMCN